MKKNILFFAILLNLIPFIKTYAQGSDVLSIYSILSGSSQQIEGKLPEDNELKHYNLETSTQFCYGLGITYKFLKSDFIAFGIGIEYMQQGSEIFMPMPDSWEENIIGEVKTFNKIHYISLPVSISLYPIRNEYNPFVLLGLRINRRIFFDSDYNPYGFQLQNKKEVTYSLQIGAGCEIKINKILSLLPQIRYNHDMLNSLNAFSIRKNDLELKNYSLDFLLGVKIR